ncbi:hypothetical protein [Marinicrinis sediminis]|uniref:Uncharacterized protein n=1 Tax=Marinicrinis sediminis TaxID=1652465 RepID=A0ABW5RCA9_9BACL
MSKKKMTAIGTGFLLLLGLIAGYIYIMSNDDQGTELDEGVIQRVDISKEKKQVDDIFTLVDTHAPIEQLDYDMKKYQTSLFQSFVPEDVEIMEALLTEKEIRGFSLDYRHQGNRVSVVYFEDGKVSKTISNGLTAEINFNNEQTERLDFTTP